MLDTHLLLWAAGTPERLSAAARDLIEGDTTELLFSVVSVWEVAIKFSLGRSDFRTDPRLFRSGLLAAGYGELAITAAHAMAVGFLPLVHRDPFDRLLVAQTLSENVTLLTVDPVLARYSGPVRLV